MHDISYVIASVPRSGTGYTAKVLEYLGLNCTHEVKFNPWTSSTIDFYKRTFGDSSWMVAPYISRLPKNTIVIHQVRDPVATLNSNLKPQHTPSSLVYDWSKRPPENPYSQFLWDHTRDWVWAPTERERIMQFWVGWHKKIEYEVSKRSDLRYVRLKVEELDELALFELAKAICPTCWDGKGPCTEYLYKALALVPTNYNRHGAVGAKFNTANISPQVKELAKVYGYTYKDKT